MANLLSEEEELRRFNAAQSDQPWYARALPMEGRATILPFRDTMPGSVFNKREFALPGLLAEAVNAFTSPARSLLGTDPEFNPQKEAANMALNMFGGGIATGKALTNPTGVGGADVGMFIGKNSPLWNENAPKILGPDGLYRQEISDKFSKLSGNKNYEDTVMDTYRAMIGAGMKNVDEEVFLKDVFNHPELFKAYPELEKYKMRILSPDSKAHAKKGSDMTISVRANATPEEARSSILHEIQHHIQENEGFARGGSASVFAKELMQDNKNFNAAIDAINIRLKNAVGTPKYDDLLGQREALIKEARDSGFLSPEMVMQTATNKYARLGGEAEARLTQARRDMTPDELAAQAPFDPKYFKEKTGIDIEDLIFQGLLSK